MIWADRVLREATDADRVCSLTQTSRQVSLRWGEDRAPPPRTRPRELGIDLGELPVGPLNAITDVPGVMVGHVTCWSDAPVARTGLTAILPDSLEGVFHRPPAAGVAVLNGVGELTGSPSIAE